MNLRELVHKIQIRQQHCLIFRKNMMNLKGNNVYNLQYETINDGYIISQARTAAAANNCEIISYREHNYMTEGRVMKIKGLKQDYVSFCADFCDAMQHYIKDIQF